MIDQQDVEKVLILTFTEDQDNFVIKSEGGPVVVIPALYIRFVGRILFLLKEKFPIKCFVDKMIVNIFHWKWL